MRLSIINCLFGTALACLSSLSRAQDSRITVDLAKTGPRLSLVQHGIFFEEINHAGDGGLNAELIRNGNFADGITAWLPIRLMSLGHTALISKHDTGGKEEVEVTIVGETGVHITGEYEGGLRNDGYFGIGISKDRDYILTIEARTESGPNSSIKALLMDAKTPYIAVADIEGVGSRYVRQRVILRPYTSSSEAHLEIRARGPSVYHFREISLRPRGVSGPAVYRKDLADLVTDMKPSFARFPGGCFVEGDKLANRFNWKTSLGPPSQRRAHKNLWGYTCSNGLGYHEFLLWCEKLKAEPLFVVNCGMSHTDIVPTERMHEYVQDALDAIEYANGPVTSTWGAKRAAAGHPKPFGLKYIEIGNENGGRAYEERYALFYDAIKQRYPEMTLIANVPVRSRPMDIVDEHYYSNPRFFVQQSHRYDTYPRAGPKVYVGEYAVTEGCGQGNLIAALGEAYFITGMERNADVVRMASYAPLFVNVNDRKWNPDAIVFDSLRSFGTPSYWVQQMFSTNRGDVVVKSTVEQLENRKSKIENWTGAVGVGTWLTRAEFKDLKVERNGQVVWRGDSAAQPLKPQSGDWMVSAGIAAQRSVAADCRAVGGDAAWGDLTFSCKARKLGGVEGFLILFRAKDRGNFFWWNLGGWGNTRHNMEHAVDGGKSLVTADVTGRIETGRWYDIRIELAGSRIHCYLDDKLIHDVTYAHPEEAPLGVIATREEKSGDLLIKVVNITDQPQDTEIAMQGVKRVSASGTVTVLTSEKPAEENSFDNPRKVAPVTRSLTGITARFTHRFPAYSVSILRFKTR